MLHRLHARSSYTNRKKNPIIPHTIDIHLPRFAFVNFRVYGYVYVYAWITTEFTGPNQNPFIYYIIINVNADDDDDNCCCCLV